MAGRKKDPNAVSIYTSIPVRSYDLIHELSKKNRRSIAGEIAMAIEAWIAGSQGQNERKQE